MASRKISYNEAKKGINNEQLAEAFNRNASESQSIEKAKYPEMEIESIRLDPDFQVLFPLDNELVNYLANSMTDKGYDKSKAVDLAIIMDEPDTKENPILIEGHQRLAAAKIAEIEKIPVYIHTYETRKEALIAAIDYQVKRRNMTDGQKAQAIMRLDELKNPGRKAEDDTETTGKSSEATAKLLNISPRNVEKVRNVLNNGDEETKQALLNDELSINKADKNTNAKKPKAKKEIEDNENDDDISDSLSSSDGIPSGLNFNHSDGYERPTHPASGEEDPNNESDKLIMARREAREEGYNEGLKVASDISFDIFCFALAEIIKGRCPEAVFIDERVSDFSPSVIKNFKLPEDDEEIISNLQK